MSVGLVFFLFSFFHIVLSKYRPSVLLCYSHSLKHCSHLWTIGTNLIEFRLCLLSIFSHWSTFAVCMPSRKNIPELTNGNTNAIFGKRWFMFHIRYTMCVAAIVFENYTGNIVFHKNNIKISDPFFCFAPSALVLFLVFAFIASHDCCCCCLK